jgi:hypothetical protein
LVFFFFSFLSAIKKKKKKPSAYYHLVSERCSGLELRCGLSIGASLDDFTVPEVITLAMACIPADTWLSRALGVSRNSIVSPVGTRVPTD